jgi:aryl-alcohol dehydrogenase-like predicted oxidoreductase
LDLYQIHSATLDSGVLDDRTVLEELGRLKGEGLRIGISLSGPGQGETLRRALAIKLDGRRLFDAVQASWNLLEPSAGEPLAEAHAAGMGVIVKEALANGRLTTRNDDPAFAGSRRMLEEEATRLGTSIDAMALAAVLAQQRADVVLTGAATTEQLASNLTAPSVTWDDRAAERLGAVAEGPDNYWSTRSRLPWN